MSSHIEKQNKVLTQWLKNLSVICHDAAKALKISEGEFFVWYGSPFVLQCKSDR